MLEIMKYILLLSLNLLKELTFKDQSNRNFYYVLIGEVLVSILNKKKKLTSNITRKLPEHLSLISN